MDLVIVGTIGLDDVKTPFGDVKEALGGSGAYSSCAASFFAKPGLVSVAGTDLPEDHSKLLEGRGVDLAGVERKGKNFRWTGAYEYDMNEAKTLKTELNSLLEFEADLPESYTKAQYLFLANTDPDIQLKVLGQMKNKPFTLVDTMNYWISSKKERLLEVISKIDAVLLNEGEARQLFDTPNLIKAGRQILELGPRYAIIKKGEHGALLFSSDNFFSAPGYPLEEVKDPTGAGDSFAGSIIGYLTKTNDTSEGNLRKAVIYGSTVASFCAESFSLDYLKTTNEKEIKERYEVFQKIRQF